MRLFLDLLDHVSVTPLDQDLLLRALSLGWDDVEDAVQGLSAQTARADYLVTRNPSDFPSTVVAVVTPPQLLAILRSEDDGSGSSLPPRDGTRGDDPVRP